MLKSELQEMLQNEYVNGFSDGRKIMEQDITEATNKGALIDINGDLFIIVKVWHNLKNKR